MIKKILFWLLAFIITVSAALFQRMTGPTNPIRGGVFNCPSCGEWRQYRTLPFISGEFVSENQIAKYKFYRSQEGTNNHRVALLVTDKDITGVLKFKRHKSSDAITEIPMILQGDSLYAEFPAEPPAGKIEYQVFLSKEEDTSIVAMSAQQELEGEEKEPRVGNKSIAIPDHPVIIRFKGHVPDIFLIPHIIIMFVAMFFSVKAGIDALQKNANLKWIVTWTLALLTLGGLVLGPIVQYYAFGVFWTGFPFGTDLTDNKTLIAFIFWVIAFIAIRKEKSIRMWTLIASVVLFLAYMVPHSLFGSELDYSNEQTEQPLGEQIYSAPHR
jgi:hypothetical protein